MHRAFSSACRSLSFVRSSPWGKSFFRIHRLRRDFSICSKSTTSSRGTTCRKSLASLQFHSHLKNCFTSRRSPSDQRSRRYSSAKNKNQKTPRAWAFGLGFGPLRNTHRRRPWPRPVALALGVFLVFRFSASDFPVGQDDPRFGTRLGVSVQRHPKIRPPHARSAPHELPVCSRVLPLTSECDATSSASPSVIRQNRDQHIEVVVIARDELENAQLLSHAALHQRNRMANRESDESVRVIQHQRVAECQLFGEAYLA